MLRPRAWCSGLLLLLAAFLLALAGFRRRLRAFGNGGRSIRGPCPCRPFGGLVLVTRALALLDARGLTGQVTQVVEARLVNATTRDHFDLVDVRRVVREDPLDADAVRNLADGERRASAFRDAADAHAFERLQAGLLAFANLRPHFDRVAGAKLRQCSLPKLALVDRVENPLSTH